VSTGVFEKVDRPSGGFKGKIEGTATAVPNETATATIAIATPSPSPSPIPSPSPSPSPSPTATSASPSPIPDSITYRLSAEFRPDAGIFYGVGTYRIIGGTGKFEGARGFGVFIGLADLDGGTYNCFLRGTISY
jgi:hypothetical protein